ncbi:MAG TPA: hypothetical protein VIP53_05600 [Nitrososphaera sp.]
MFAPIVPLPHSWPSNAPPPSAPMAFHSSLLRAMTQIGLEIDGNGDAILQQGLDEEHQKYKDDIVEFFMSIKDKVRIEDLTFYRS